MAWAVVSQGAATAASARGGAIEIGAVAADLERCAAGADQRQHAPTPHHLACSCCLSCRTGHIGGLVGPPLSSGAGRAAPAPGIFLAGLFADVEAAAAPHGWISSWSSRAPPIA